MDAYAAAKARIFENQTEEDFAILNADDPATTPLAPDAARALLVQPQAARGARRVCCAATKLCFAMTAKKRRCSSAQDIPLPGAHNLENVLAAVAATRLAGAERRGNCAKGCARLPESSIAWSLSRRSTACATTTIRRPPTWTRR